MNLRAPRLPQRFNPARNDFTLVSIALMLVALLATLFRDRLGNLFASDPLLTKIDHAITFDEHYLAKSDLNLIHQQRATIHNMLLDIAADPVMAGKLSRVLGSPNFQIAVIDEATLASYGHPQKNHRISMFFSANNMIFLTADNMRHLNFRTAFLHELHHALIFHIQNGVGPLPFVTEQDYQSLKTAVDACYHFCTTTLESLWKKNKAGELTPEEKAQFLFYENALNNYLPKVFVGDWTYDESTHLTIQRKLNNHERVFTIAGNEVLFVENVNGEIKLLFTNTGSSTEKDNVRTFISDMKHNQLIERRVAAQNPSCDKQLAYQQVYEADAELHANPQISLFCPKLTKYHEDFQRRMLASTSTPAPAPARAQRM